MRTGSQPTSAESLPQRLIAAGGKTKPEAGKCSKRVGRLVAFGRLFTSNPDLPARIQHGYPLATISVTHFFGGRC
ncbi:hypothetical protein LZ023_37035 (plasmid) [Pseudomonas silvicola]|nr:hypothetical protein LZ023_37035 [Pseudomonas silvicola]